MFLSHKASAQMLLTMQSTDRRLSGDSNPVPMHRSPML